MRVTMLATALAVAAAAVAGCKDDPKPAPAPAPAPASPSMTPPSSTTQPSMAGAATQAAGEAAGGMMAKAQDLYDKAMMAVKDKKWEDAKGYLKQLDGYKSQLSPEWQSKIDGLQKMVTMGEGVGGASTNPAGLIPGGLPKIGE